MWVGREALGELLVDDAEVRPCYPRCPIDVDDAYGGDGIGHHLAKGCLQLDVVAHPGTVVCPQPNCDGLEESEVVTVGHGLR